MTKKEFKEKSAIHTYGGGLKRRVRLYFDWNNDPSKGAIGYKYCVIGYGCTKAQILTDAYDMLIKKVFDALCWYDYKEAKTDAERFKVSIVG